MQTETQGNSLGTKVKQFLDDINTSFIRFDTGKNQTTPLEKNEYSLIRNSITVYEKDGVREFLDSLGNSYKLLERMKSNTNSHPKQDSVGVTYKIVNDRMDANRLVHEIQLRGVLTTIVLTTSVSFDELGRRIKKMAN